MFPAAPHSAAHGDRCHHGKEGDKSCGKPWEKESRLPHRLLPGRFASHALQKCCVCTPKCVLGICILVPLGGPVLPCTLTVGSDALGAAPTGFMHPHLLVEGRTLLIYFIYSLWGGFLSSLKHRSPAPFGKQQISPGNAFRRHCCFSCVLYHTLKNCVSVEKSQE